MALDDVLKEVRRRRRTKEPLRRQLAWRVAALLPYGNLDDESIRAAFPEVFAAFAPTGFELRPDPELCHIDDAGGGSIVVGGTLYASGRKVGLTQRRLLLGDGFAIHEVLVLEEEVRGHGVSAVLLKRTFELYDELAFPLVVLQADLTGKWHWARLGFDFVLDRDLANVRSWTERALAALEITDLRVDRYTSAAQFARMGGNRKISLGSLAAALPAAERRRIARIAAENGLALDQEVALARALMICGPRWFGRLELRGPGRIAFEAYTEARIRPQRS